MIWLFYCHYIVSYVVLENLRYLLTAYNTSKPLYFGHKFKTHLKKGFMHGGPGIFTIWNIWLLKCPLLLFKDTYWVGKLFEDLSILDWKMGNIVPKKLMVMKMSKSVHNVMYS